MPNRPPRPCKQCGALLLDGLDCPSHPQVIALRVARTDRRASSSARGYGWSWKIKVRDPFIAANPWCADPYHIHGDVKVRSQMVDHIVPRPEGTDNASNLQALCFKCHRIKTPRDGSGGGSKTMQGYA